MQKCSLLVPLSLPRCSTFTWATSEAPLRIRLGHYLAGFSQFLVGSNRRSYMFITLEIHSTSRLTTGRYRDNSKNASYRLLMSVTCSTG
ncbi:hypothetical protein BU23DRAFT_267821 [Bimuria novae-zelandiae CBS 107.79]|uniref:Uncharacterized protein n=1 Tax=Bimuria novae-zelandiae CBS 107.79 TaxID=1447943 RepID=A0A6A5USX5_9PLEO|nr:hypothetical protein BU23DRAFT_267821 [Bimuria novae-zelandiae CBS 107.79]